MTKSKKMICVLLALALSVASVQCEVFTIVPSVTSDCPGELTGEVCLTFQQYIINPSQASVVVLSLQPGLHSLPASFSTSSSANFSMIAEAGATIACSSPSHTLAFTEIGNINFSGIAFTGCGNFRIAAVRVQFTGVSFRGCGDIRIEESALVQLTHVTITGSGGTFISHRIVASVQLTHVAFRNNRPTNLDTLFIGYPFRRNPDPASNAILRNVTFRDNSAGCGVRDMYTVVFDYVTWINSKGIQASSRNGPQTSFSMTNSFFSHNDGRVGRALDLINMRKIHIDSLTFVDNEGGMRARCTTRCASLTVENSIFLRNSFDARFMSSGFQVAASNVTILNCTFNSNTGTALAVTSGNFLIQDCRFANNGQGAIANYGGGVYCSAITMTVSNSTFDSNRASLGGGAIGAIPSTSIFSSGNVFFNNSAGSGAALFLQCRSCSVVFHSTDDVFMENKASISGGAIYSNITSTMSIVESTFDSNSALSCGAVFASNHVTVYLNSSSFTGNAATGSVIGGGGVGCVRNALVLIENTTFTYNRANAHAGVLVVDDSSVSVSDSTFLSNSAAVNGGVFYTGVISTDYSISHCVFSQNSAGGSGGVLYLNREGSQVTVNESIISFNSAANRGGAFSVISSSLNITMSNIYSNTADKGSSISACNSEVQVQGLQSSVDTSQPICDLYEGFINTSNIVPPHDLNTLVTTSAPTSTLPPTANPRNPTTVSAAMSTSNSPPPTAYITASSAPPKFNASITTAPTQYLATNAQPIQDQLDENRRLTILVCIFAALFGFVLLYSIVLTTKVIFDCVRARCPKHSRSQNISLGTTNQAAQTNVYFMPLQKKADSTD